jgi:hypothetical protein
MECYRPDPDNPESLRVTVLKKDTKDIPNYNNCRRKSRVTESFGNNTVYYPLTMREIRKPDQA